MSLIDALGATRRDALRQLAGRIGASDDTAVSAWLAWQAVASMAPAERQQAVAMFLGLEELKRASEGRDPMFSVVGKQ